MKNALILFASTAALVVACNHQNEPTPVTTTGAPGIVANEDAIHRLTAATCERARECNQLGGDKKYADEAACGREIHHNMESDLRPAECPGGIRQTKLSNCLQEVKNEKCGNPFDKISRLATCRTGMLCID